jgi:hypothetical protein
VTGPAEPFRLDDAVIASEPFAFTFRGIGYVLPPVTAWPITAMTAIATGLVTDALGELLGEAAAERLADDGMTVGHMKALLEEASKAGDKRKLPPRTTGHNGTHPARRTGGVPPCGVTERGVQRPLARGLADARRAGLLLGRHRVLPPGPRGALRRVHERRPGQLAPLLRLERHQRSAP